MNGTGSDGAKNFPAHIMLPEIVMLMPVARLLVQQTVVTVTMLMKFRMYITFSGDGDVDSNCESTRNQKFEVGGVDAGGDQPLLHADGDGGVQDDNPNLNVEGGGDPPQIPNNVKAGADPPPSNDPGILNDLINDFKDNAGNGNELIDDDIEDVGYNSPDFSPLVSEDEEEEDDDDDDEVDDDGDDGDDGEEEEEINPVQARQNEMPEHFLEWFDKIILDIPRRN